MLPREDIRVALAAHPPRLIEDPARAHAAVAVVLREAADAARSPELLLIERSRHEGDPWSGHMAFPGGRVEPGDPDSRATAERETFEEVGLPLAGADLLGRLDDVEGRQGRRSLPLVVSAWVYHVPEPGPLALNYEVEEALWVPVRRLVDPRHHVEYPTPPWTGYPGILVGRPDRHVVWGLTYRFLEIFLEKLGHPLPDRWSRVPEARPDE
ncbi:MAG: CoA pyrophosphatase [Deltaproteobacteria bacterium]|nr:CoA pyrophosphatase [Deltaproteobacteria bacterium]